MKIRLCILVAAMAVALPVTAAEATAKEETKVGKYEKGGKYEKCVLVELNALSVMRSRQNGTPMSKLVEISSKTEKSISDISPSLVEQAYAIPQFDTDEARNKSAKEFANKAYLACVEQIDSTSKK